MAKYKKTDESPLEDRRGAVDQKKKEGMLAVLIRNPAAFEAVADHFGVDEAERVSSPLALVWKVTRKFYKKYGELPGKTQLQDDLQNALSADPTALVGEESAEVDAFLDFAFDDEEHGADLGKSVKHLRVAVDTCKELLEEILAESLKKSLTADGSYPADVANLFETAQAKIDRIQAMTETDVEEPFPEGWDKRAESKLLTTGVAALDMFMGGGWKAGETIVFLAPYGSCKTTLACFSTAVLARRCAEDFAAGKVRKRKGKLLRPVVVLIFTEGSMDDYRVRLMSCLATVPWSRLGQMGSLADLDAGTGPGQPSDKSEDKKHATAYELKEFAATDKKAKWFNETQRVQRGAKLANKHMILIDCSNSETNKNRIGAGGMSEVANVVTGLFRRRKDCYPVAIWLDHMSGLVDRMSDVITDEVILRRTLTNMPRIAQEKLAARLKCPVGILHQFAGAEQKKGVLAQFHHGDAEGSKQVGKYADFCFVSGPVDENGMCNWRNTKHRRSPPSPTRIVQVVGDFNRLVDMSTSHAVVPGQNIIMSKSDIKMNASVAVAKEGGFHQSGYTM